MIIMTSTFLKWHSPQSKNIPHRGQNWKTIHILTWYMNARTHTHVFVCVCVCVCVCMYIYAHIHTMILSIFSTQQQLTAWLTFMASSHVTVNESAIGNMFSYIFQKSSITKATQNRAFLLDINYECCSSYGFATGKQCCTPPTQPIAQMSMNCLLSSTISSLQTINWVVWFTLHSRSVNAREYHNKGLHFCSNIHHPIWTLTLTHWQTWTTYFSFLMFSSLNYVRFLFILFDKNVQNSFTFVGGPQALPNCASAKSYEDEEYSTLTE